MAEQDVAARRASSSPSLDLVARAGRDRLSGSGDFGPASNTSRSAMLGVELTVPVFTGGARSARYDGARASAEQARAEEDAARRRIVLQARAAWLSLASGAERVEALAAGERASLQRVEATRLAHDNGERSTLDLLQAEADEARAALALLEGRASLVLDRLRLAAAAGALDEDELARADALLEPAGTH